MRRIFHSLFSASLILFLSLLDASAQRRDRTPPTQPTNLVVTGMTSYSVTLAWNPSSDNSGSFTYVICCANTSSETVPQTATSHTYRAGLEAGRSFTLRIQAVDAAGNYSTASNSVTFTLPADKTPPTKPIVVPTDIGRTHVSLAWSSTDDGPHVWYTIYRNGQPVLNSTSATSGTFFALDQSTSYTFTVQARDFAANWSAFSEPVTVTTQPPNPDDHTPPTRPTNITEDHYEEDIELSWDPSTDDFDPPSLIRYDVYVNGVLIAITVGKTRRIVVSGTPGEVNTITIIAIDTSDNASEPGVITVIP
jgi:chitodextrinase